MVVVVVVAAGVVVVDDVTAVDEDNCCGLPVITIRDFPDVFFDLINKLLGIFRLYNYKIII